MAAPIPRPTPVTSATYPSRRNSSAPAPGGADCPACVIYPSPRGHHLRQGSLSVPDCGGGRRHFHVPEEHRCARGGPERGVPDQREYLLGGDPVRPEVVLAAQLVVTDSSSSHRPRGPGPARLRLLLSRDRRPARHPPPSRSAATGSVVLMSARCVTDWTWPLVQVAVSRRLLLHVRKAGDARWRPSEHMPRSLGLTIR